MPRLSSPRRARRGIAIIALGLSAALALGACSSRGAEAKPETAAKTDKPIEITDQRGKTITFEKPVTKIATTVIPSPSMIAAIDQSYDKIVGVNAATILRDKPSIFGKMFPKALTNTAIAGPDFVPNIEEITKLKPDVVIQWADQGDAAKMIKPIEDAGIPVIGLKYGTQEDLETWVKLFAKLLDKQDRGEELLNRMHSTMSALQSAAKKEKKHPKALYLRRAGDGGYNAGMGSKRGYMNTWMTVAGAENVAADAEYSITNPTNVEQIVKWNPEVIFTSAMTPLSPADIYADPALSAVDAVKNKRVYAVPSGGFWWDPPSAESQLVMRWAAQLLYPDFKGSDLKKAMQDDYEFLYGHKLTHDEIDMILRVKENAQSAGYERLAH